MALTGDLYLLAAISQLGTVTPQSSSAQDINITPDSLESNTNRGVSVKLENTSTNDVQEALKNLHFKHTCTSEQQEQEEEEREQKRANQTDSKEQEQKEPELFTYPGEGWIDTTSELFTISNDNGTFTQAYYHKFHLDNPKYPLICTTLGKGYLVHTALLPTPVLHPKNYFTATQNHLFSGRELFTKVVTYATSNLGDEGLLAALHAYCHWEQEEMFTTQHITHLNSQKAFQHIKMLEWREALINTNTYDRVVKEMETHVP